MDHLTEIIRAEILRQYHSVRQFSFAVDIPLSTINSALHHGIGGSSFDTVMHICRTLGIKSVSESSSASYMSEDTIRLLEQYSQLDEYGRHTVETVVQVEHARCTGGKA